MFQGFRFNVLLAAMLPLSCATPHLQPVNNLSKLDGTNSIIFGKIECWKNDKLMVKQAQKYSDPTMMFHISRYVSDASLNTNLWKAGEYCFEVPVFKGGIKDGYFSFVVPAGKYYFVELDYFNFFAANPIVGMRTYSGKQPVLMIFDAPANQAVYIGTLRNRFNVLHDNLLFYEVAMKADVANDFEDATNWFLKSNPRFETNVVEGIVKIRNLPK
jgi:hypothetical protein